MKLFLARIASGVVVFSAIAFLFFRGSLEKLELILYDWRLKTTHAPDSVGAPFALVGITENFQAKIGESFSRKHHTRLIKLLEKDGVAVIGFDIFFEKADTPYDPELIAAIRNNRHVVLPVFSPNQPECRGNRHLTDIISGTGPDFQRAAAALGHINTIQDKDQNIRRMPLFLDYITPRADLIYPHLSAELVRLYRHEKAISGIPLDSDGTFYINFVRPEEMRKRYFIPFEDVLLGDCPRGTFTNKIVLVAQTALGKQNADLLATPFRTQFGAVVQASVLSTLLKQNYIRRPDRKTTALSLLGICLLLPMLLSSRRNTLNTAVFVLFSAAVFLSGLLVFEKRGLFLDLVPFLGAGAACYVTSLGFSIGIALKKVFQKETAFHMLEDAEREITNLLKPAEFFGLAQNFTFSGFQTEDMLKRTPEITLHTLLASLGISSGIIIFTGAGRKNQEIAAHGHLCRKADADYIVKQVMENKRSFIVNTAARRPWIHSADIGNVMAVPIIVQPAFGIIGIFFNKLPTLFSDSPNFTDDDARLAGTLSLQAIVAIQNANLNLALKDAQLETIFRLAVAIEYRDRETGMHIHRVSEYAAIVAAGLNLPPAEVELVKSAMPMHDIGKIAIPDNILLKPGRLTDEEREIIKKHTLIGAKMLEGSASLVLQAAEIIALNHQERYDGSGYPHGLKGNAIPIYGRIAALVDIFDALSSKRIYKEAVDFEESLRVLKQESGKSTDPKIADLFCQKRADIERIYNSYRETENAEFFDILK